MHLSQDLNCNLWNLFLAPSRYEYEMETYTLVESGFPMKAYTLVESGFPSGFLIP